MPKAAISLALLWQILSGTGLNEAADAAVERSLEVDARAPGGARGVAGVARCHPR